MGRKKSSAEQPANEEPANDRILSVSARKQAVQSICTHAAQLACHGGPFGQELHDQHKQFNVAFSEVYKLMSEAGHSVKSCIPFRELFLQDYSGLEKMLVLINLVLFTSSLSSVN